MPHNISSLDCAYNYLTETGTSQSFADIWNHVVTELELENPDDKISGFYTNLTLDGRFVTLGENVWDLRSRQTFDKVHIDMNDVYADSDFESEEDEDEETEEEEPEETEESI